MTTIEDRSLRERITRSVMSTIPAAACGGVFSCSAKKDPAPKACGHHAERDDDTLVIWALLLLLNFQAPLEMVPVTGRKSGRG
jgi:hypothetical protein